MHWCCLDFTSLCLHLRVCVCVCITFCAVWKHRSNLITKVKTWNSFLTGSVLQAVMATASSLIRFLSNLQKPFICSLLHHFVTSSLPDEWHHTFWKLPWLKLSTQVHSFGRFIQMVTSLLMYEAFEFPNVFGTLKDHEVSQKIVMARRESAACSLNCGEG